MNHDFEQLRDVLVALNDADALTNLGSTFINLKQYDEALQTFEQAIRLDPKNTNAYTYKGILLLLPEKYNEVLEIFEHVTSLELKLNHKLHLAGVQRFDLVAV